MPDMDVKGSVQSVENIDQENLCFSWIEDKELFERLKQSGMRVAHFAIYTCAKDAEALNFLVRNFKLGSQFSHYFDFVEMPPAYYSVVDHSMYFDDDFKGMISIERKRMQGWKLRVVTSAPLKFDATDFQFASKSAVNQLRLLVGDFMAWEFDFDFFIDLCDFTAKTTGQETIKATLDPTRANSIFEEREFGGFDVLDPTINSLLERSWSTDSPAIKFLLLWTVIEMKLGNGGERKRFCKETLGSNWLNDELYRLHGVRTGIVHYGRSKVSGNDIQMLKGVVRICLMQSTEDQCFATEALKELSNQTS